MLKAALGALVVAGAFGLALYGGGNVMGAWAPYEAPGASGSLAQPSDHSPTPRRPVARRKARDGRWIRRADAICLDAHRAAAGMRQPRTAEEIRTFLTRGVKENRRWNRRFLRLGAPRGQEQRFARLRTLFREDEAILSDLASAMRREDWASAMLLGERLMSLARRESNVMMSLGARECALPSDAI
jgi:hypothetical protein